MSVSLLDPPRCPNCSSIVDLSELYRVAPKTGDTLIGRVGIVCPVCGMNLRVLQARAFLVGLLTFLLALGVAAVVYIIVPVGRGTREYSVRMGVFFVVMWAAIVLHRRSIPRLLAVRLLKNGENVRFPLTPTPKTEEVAELRSALHLAPVEENRPTWNCTNCGEQNPGNFDECWKCQTWRSEESNAK